jgi:hypothetical protein
MKCDKGTKVRHKTKGMVETVVGLCKVKYMGVWVDGVIYEGNDVHTGEPMTFVRVKEDFENNFEAIKDMPSEKKNNFLTSSYPSGANAQQAYRSKYDESII